MTTQYKPSEVMRIMREKIETVPSHLINMRYYRPTNIPATFITLDDRGIHGDIAGWAATTPELAPVQADYYRDYCEDLGGMKEELLWEAYLDRLLGLDDEWESYPFYKDLFDPDSYHYEPGDFDSLKAEILRRLESAENALKSSDEDPRSAYRII